MKFPLHIKAEFNWLIKSQTPAIRNMLFCINGACVTGRIISLREIESDLFEIGISFINVDFFRDRNELFAGQLITIQEGMSIIIANGKISEVPV